MAEAQLLTILEKLRKFEDISQLFKTFVKHVALTLLFVHPESIGRMLYITTRLDVKRVDIPFTIPPSSEVEWIERAPSGKVYVIYKHQLQVSLDGVVELSCVFDGREICYIPAIYNDMYKQPEFVLLPVQEWRVKMINHDDTNEVTVIHKIEYSTIKIEQLDRLRQEVTKMIQGASRELGIPVS